MRLHNKLTYDWYWHPPHGELIKRLGLESGLGDVGVQRSNSRG